MCPLLKTPSLNNPNYPKIGILTHPNLTYFLHLQLVVCGEFPNESVSGLADEMIDNNLGVHRSRAQVVSPTTELDLVKEEQSTNQN